VPHPQAIRIRDDVGFFRAVHVALNKSVVSRGQPSDRLDQALQQFVSNAITSDQVVDIFAVAGLKPPEFSILSDIFLAEVAGMPHKNLAVEVLQKLLRDEIRVRERTFLVQSRSFRQRLEEAVRRYQNRALEAVEVIEELIALAKEMRQAHQRGEALGLTEEELAF